LRAPDKFSRFEEAVMPHLDAAYNLARYLMRNDYDADDAVQDACLRALRHFGGFRGGDGRVWLLKIARNACYTRLKRGRARELEAEFDDELASPDSEVTNPETLVLRSADAGALIRALDQLPEEFREILVMREMEGLSYKEIADGTTLPIGTVMSRLARARKRMQRLLLAGLAKES
jgi:RNA polymerase sigma-70 factor, ECF subfamily